MTRLILAALAVMLVSEVWAQDAEHIQMYHDTSEKDAWFKSLRQPGSGMSCCSKSDCERTKAEFIGGQWQAVVNGAWTVIPPEKLLDTMSYDGEAYVCNSPSGAIYCFVRPGGGA
jgi:hypothetical protein